MRLCDSHAARTPRKKTKGRGRFPDLQLGTQSGMDCGLEKGHRVAIERPASERGLLPKAKLIGRPVGLCVAIDSLS